MLKLVDVVKEAALAGPEVSCSIDELFIARYKVMMYSTIIISCRFCGAQARPNKHILCYHTVNLAVHIMHSPVCMCVSVCVRSNLPPHKLDTQKRDTNGFIAIQEPFKILKIFKKFFVQKLWRNFLTSSSSGVLYSTVFSPRNKLLC